MTQNTRESALDERQMRAVVLLTQGHKRLHVARELGVDPTTLRRWLREPAVAALLAEAQADSLESACVRLGGLVDGALDAIESVLADLSAPAAARLRAAELVLARVFDAQKIETTQADPADVQRALAFIQWEQAQERPRDEGDG